MPVASRPPTRPGPRRSAGSAPKAAAARSVPAPAHALLALVWDSPFPASLQDAAFRFVDVNPAFAAFVGLPREALIGTDFIAIQFEQDRPATLESRARIAAAGNPTGSAYVPDGRLLHSDGQERWFRAARHVVTGADGRPQFLAVLQDTTSEHAARERADRSVRELDDWFDLSPVGMVLFDDSGLLIRSNPAFDEMAGGVPVALDESAPSLARLLAWGEGGALERLQPGSPAIETQGWVTRPDGQMRRLRAIIRCYRTARGERRFMGIVADRSVEEERDLALESLASERENLAGRTRAILDSVLVGIVTVGADGIEWMNRSAQRMFSGSLADFAGRPMSVIAAPEEPDHPFLSQDDPGEPIGGEVRTFECRVRGRDGRTFWVVGNAVATPGAGRARQLTYALLDIERRRQAEAAVFEAQASLRRVIEAAPLAIALLDAKTLAIVQVNDVAARTVGELPEDLLGTTPEDVFGPELGAVRRGDMEHALRTSGLTQREYRYERDGETRIWDARYLPLAADAGAAPDQLLLVATDVTEQRAAEEARLEAAIAQRDMLVKEVHHRIKNNLQGVAGLLQQIAQRKPEVAAAIDEVVGQVQAIAQVHGLQVGATGPLAVTSILVAITASVQRTFGRPIRCDVGAAEAAAWILPEVESIPIALTINELLTNAVKHSTGSAPAEDIVCTLECDASGVRVSISNTAVLAKGFSLARIPNGVSGLGLVRALLPRRSATLRIEQFGAQVMATVTLRPPVVARTGGA